MVRKRDISIFMLFFRKNTKKQKYKNTKIQKYKNTKIQIS